MLATASSSHQRQVYRPDARWAPRPRADNAMVKALARAFRWRKMLDNGVYATLEILPGPRASTRHTSAASRG